tara:strand:+ start:2808 stop:3095 length:288 start_codon:yes stop_codon:yes gene_type:complete
MLPSYKGMNKKYCSRKCIDDYRKANGYWAKLYIKQNPERLERKCGVCKRNINSLGRKHISKYCSKKCLYLAGKIASGQKTVFVKIPVEKIPLLYT